MQRAWSVVYNNNYTVYNRQTTIKKTVEVTQLNSAESNPIIFFY